MDEVIARFNAAGIRYVVIGGQAVRLAGLPRFSMDWDVFVPPRDAENIARINTVLANELDLPLVPLGTRGENAIQTYQTRWGILQFHLGGPGLPPFEEAERTAVTHQTEYGTPVLCLSGVLLLESKKRVGRPEDQADIRFLEAKQRQGLL
jgi:hypothetical protein